MHIVTLTAGSGARSISIRRDKISAVVEHADGCDVYFEGAKDSFSVDQTHDDVVELWTAHPASTEI